MGAHFEHSPRARYSALCGWGQVAWITAVRLGRRPASSRPVRARFSTASGPRVFGSPEVQSAVADTWREFICGMPDGGGRQLADDGAGGPLICDGLQYGVASHSYRTKRAARAGGADQQVRYLVVNNYKQWIEDVLAATAVTTAAATAAAVEAVAGHRWTMAAALAAAAFRGS